MRGAARHGIIRLGVNLRWNRIRQGVGRGKGEEGKEYFYYVAESQPGSGLVRAASTNKRGVLA